MEAFENDLNDYLNKQENKCAECGTPISDNKVYCSKTCFKTSLL